MLTCRLKNYKSAKNQRYIPCNYLPYPFLINPAPGHPRKVLDIILSIKRKTCQQAGRFQYNFNLNLAAESYGCFPAYLSLYH